MFAEKICVTNRNIFHSAMRLFSICYFFLFIQCFVSLPSWHSSLTFPSNSIFHFNLLSLKFPSFSFTLYLLLFLHSNVTIFLVAFQPPQRKLMDTNKDVIKR